jgi:transposase InsO family protein
MTPLQLTKRTHPAAAPQLHQPIREHVPVADLGRAAASSRPRLSSLVRLVHVRPQPLLVGDELAVDPGESPALFDKRRGGDVSVRRSLGATRWRRWSRTCPRCTRAPTVCPRITANLTTMGWAVSKNTVADLMPNPKSVARSWRGVGARPAGATRKAPDLLKRDFCVANVNDLHSKQVVGFAMGARHDANVATAALSVAIAIRGGDVAGVSFHSDQGGEYAAHLFAQACQPVMPSVGGTQ